MTEKPRLQWVLEQAHFALFSPLEPHPKRIALKMDARLLLNLGLISFGVALAPLLGWGRFGPIQVILGIVCGAFLIWLSFHILRYLPDVDAPKDPPLQGDASIGTNRDVRPMGDR